MTTSTKTRVAANDVFSTLKQSILVDGFHLVIDLEKSHGSVLVDARDGKEYLDFYTNFASLPVGHNHPRTQDPEFQKKLLRAAIGNPANSDLYSVEFAEFVDTFRRIAQRPYLNHAFFVAGGALGVENALKASFDWKIRKNQAKGVRGELGTKVIHFNQAFHGRSGYTMSITKTDPHKTLNFPKFDWPMVDNPKCLFPLAGENLARTQGEEACTLQGIRNICERHGDDVAALIIEPIQGEGGDNHFRLEFLKGLRELADEFEFILIYDEVQTGLGLTGKFWCHEHFEGAQPDAIAFGKKAQVCGMLAGPRFDEVKDNVFHNSGRINSTWGGNLVDMVRAQLYLEIIDEDNLVENARVTGEVLLQGLLNLEAKHDAVTQARGRGLMAAFGLPDGEMRDKVLDKGREMGILALPSGPSSIRFRPTLTVSEAEINKGIDMLDQAIRACS